MDVGELRRRSRSRTVPEGIAGGYPETWEENQYGSLVDFYKLKSSPKLDNSSCSLSIDIPRATEMSSTTALRSICKSFISPVIRPLTRAKALNGSTYASNWFNGHFEIEFR